MIVYIAGPMSGIDNYNRPAFFAAARQLAEAGHVPINPATLPTTLDDKTYMPICTSMIDGADAIYLLDGWERSGGAMAEFAYARRQGKQIVTQASLLGSRAALLDKNRDIREAFMGNINIPDTGRYSSQPEEVEDIAPATKQKIAEMFGQSVRIATPQPRRKRKKYGQTRRTIDVFLEMGIHSVFLNAPDVFGRDKATLYDTMRKAIDRNYQDAPVQVMMRSGEAGVWLMRTDADLNQY